MPDAPEAKVRARAGAIGFSGATADTPAGELSGGEKARLLLGLATFAGPHLVILDEPTNHLDIDSRAALIEAINDYPGAVILVSHDRYLIEACADRLWLVADGARHAVRRRSRRLPPPACWPSAAIAATRATTGGKAAPTPRAARAEIRRAAARKAAGTRAVAPAHRRAEAGIARLTAEIARLDAALGRARTVRPRPRQGRRAGQGARRKRRRAHSAEDDWLEASAAFEAAMA